VTALRTTLRVAEFRALLVSYVINRAGDFVGALALAVIVLAATGSALATATLFLATQFVPGLIGPGIVARVDRLAPGRLLPALYLIEAVLFAVLAVIVHRVGVAVIIALALVDATLAFVARAMTRSATASTLIPHDLMPEGKAAFNAALAMAMIGGPLIGGVAVGVLSASAALAIDAGSFLVAAVVLVGAPGLRAPGGGADPDAKSAPPAGGRLREGLRYIADRPPLRALILGEGLAFVFFYLVVPVTVVYAAQSLHTGPGGYAALLTSWGVGIAIGSIVQLRLARRAGAAMILTSTAAVALGYLGTAVAPSIVFACAASVLGGIGNGTQWSSVETLLHRLVDEEFRVRTAAVLEALASLAPGVGIVVGGALTAAFSPRAAYLAAGAGLLVLVALGRALSGAFNVDRDEQPSATRPAPVAAG
jgi:predicted MFS family arabinose efflux permease